MTIVIETRDVKKIYNPGKTSEVIALGGIDMKIKKGELVAIMGPSGSGKTTLLDVIGCLLKPSSGKIFIDGVEIEKLDEDELADIRGKKIGFIFQQYNLIHTFTALENVAFAMRIMDEPKDRAMKRAKILLEMVDLGERLKHRPSELSGGEQQRVAIARALANKPKIIFGDEVTGNLDTKTTKKILELITDLNKKEGYTIILVTHDPRVCKYCDRIIKIQDGKIIERSS